eukprot:2230176-Rhodomonas_salina.2
MLAGEDTSQLRLRGAREGLGKGGTAANFSQVASRKLSRIECRPSSDLRCRSHTQPRSSASQVRHEKSQQTQYHQRDRSARDIFLLAFFGFRDTDRKLGVHAPGEGAEADDDSGGKDGGTIVVRGARRPERRSDRQRHALDLRVHRLQHSRVT